MLDMGDYMTNQRHWNAAISDVQEKMKHILDNQSCNDTKIITATRKNICHQLHRCQNLTNAHHHKNTAEASNDHEQTTTTNERSCTVVTDEIEKNTISDKPTSGWVTANLWWLWLQNLNTVNWGGQSHRPHKLITAQLPLQWYHYISTSTGKCTTSNKKGEEKLQLPPTNVQLSPRPPSKQHHASKKLDERSH